MRLPVRELKTDMMIGGSTAAENMVDVGGLLGCDISAHTPKSYKIHRTRADIPATGVRLVVACWRDSPAILSSFYRNGSRASAAQL